jgi:hypothetical protein
MNERDVALVARVAGLRIDRAHLPGVMNNLAILQAQIALLLDPPLDPLAEPAPVFRA